MEENFQINAISDSPSENLSPMNFPSDVYKWMKSNAKPKMALKLMKVCKYFKHSDGFPYLVIKEVLRMKFYGGNFLWRLDTLDGTTVEAKNVEAITENLWIVGNIEIYGGDTSVSTLLRKTVVCNVQKIKLFDQEITLNEFKFLTDGGMVEECDLIQTSVISENGEIVQLEDIFECLPNARIIEFQKKAPSFSSLEAAEAKISSKLEELNLCISSNNFNFQTLFDYMKNHQKIHYRLWFCRISKAVFRQNIAPSVNKMIQKWSPEYEKPMVTRYPRK